MCIPTNQLIDGSLGVGGLLFGAGWALADWPREAIASADNFGPQYPPCFGGWGHSRYTVEKAPIG